MSDRGWRYSWAWLTLGLVALSGFSGWSQEQQPIGAIPHLRPVIAESHRDGLLLGLDFALTLEGLGLELEAGGAYGVLSQMGRFRTGLQYQNALRISYGDWPSSLVFGRQGEQGIHASLDLLALNRLLGSEGEGLLGAVLQQSQLQGTGFLGRLWPGEGEMEGPDVRYFHLSGFLHWPLPLGITLETRGEFLFGQPLTDLESSFQTFFSSTRLWVDETTLEFRLGELDNPADLPGFRFNLGLRSYPASFAGHRFFLFSLEQGFEVLSAQIFQLDLRDILGERLGWIPVRLRLLSSVFFEGGMVLGDGEESNEVLFGWGTSLSFPDLNVNISLAVTRDGVPVLTVEAGVLP